MGGDGAPGLVGRLSTAISVCISDGGVDAFAADTLVPFFVERFFSRLSERDRDALLLAFLPRPRESRPFFAGGGDLDLDALLLLSLSFPPFFARGFLSRLSERDRDRDE